jgi:phosphoadenosine phosphosulfate reductase
MTAFEDERVAPTLALLHHVAGEHARPALASSLSVEDMVLVDLIARHALPIDVFTLDTGRLHGDTLALVDAIGRRYGLHVEVYRPLPHAVEAYERDHGRDAFFRTVALRKGCCHVRKVEPLERALAGRDAWLTGMRREQSVTRGALAASERDPARGIAKYNPLVDWTEADVWRYVRAHDVPYNRLHDEGYPSIGCAPCTRPVVPGEDVRAGRWWWEARESRECGLHVAADGRLVRSTAEATS